MLVIELKKLTLLFFMRGKAASVYQANLLLGDKDASIFFRVLLKVDMFFGLHNHFNQLSSRGSKLGQLVGHPILGECF